MRLTIGKRLTFGFAICVTITAALGFFAYNRLNGIARNVDQITHDAMPGANQAAQINGLVKTNVVLLLRHELSEDPAQMKALGGEFGKNKQKLDELFEAYKATINGPQEQQAFDELSEARKG